MNGALQWCLWLFSTHIGLQPLTTTGFFLADHRCTMPFGPPASLRPAHERLTGISIGIGRGRNAALGKRTSLQLTLAYGLDEAPLAQRNSQVTVQLVLSPLQPLRPLRGAAPTGRANRREVLHGPGDK